MNIFSRKWQVTAAVLFFLFLTVGLGWNNYIVDKRIGEISQRLLLLSNLRRGALEQYFDTAETELRFWATNKRILDYQASMLSDWRSFGLLQGDPQIALQELYIRGNPYPIGELYQLDDALDGSAYSQLHSELHPLAKLFILERGYYDFFLIGPNGNVMYSVTKEDDFASNLATGPWKDSGLAHTWRRAIEEAQKDSVIVSDLQHYSPSQEPAIFMGKALLGRRNKVLGVIAVQLPTDRIVNIMNFTSGMGETGETYLVGEDYLMRSNSRFHNESTILKTKVETDTARLALEGKEGVQFTLDYREVEVLSAYTSIELDNMRWALLAEVDREETLRKVVAERPTLAAIVLALYTLTFGSLWFGRNLNLLSVTELPDSTFDGDHLG